MFVLASTSDGLVSLSACSLGHSNGHRPSQLTWPVVAVLEAHAGPVLCLDLAVVDVSVGIGKGREDRTVAVTGGHDGSLGVWDVTEAAVQYVDHMAQVEAAANTRTKTPPSVWRHCVCSLCCFWRTGIKTGSTH